MFLVLSSESHRVALQLSRLRRHRRHRRRSAAYHQALGNTLARHSRSLCHVLHINRDLMREVNFVPLAGTIPTSTYAMSRLLFHALQREQAIFLWLMIAIQIPSILFLLVTEACLSKRLHGPAKVLQALQAVRGLHGPADSTALQVRVDSHLWRLQARTQKYGITMGYFNTVTFKLIAEVIG